MAVRAAAEIESESMQAPDVCGKSASSAEAEFNRAKSFGESNCTKFGEAKALFSSFMSAQETAVAINEVELPFNLWPCIFSRREKNSVYIVIRRRKHVSESK